MLYHTRSRAFHQICCIQVLLQDLSTARLFIHGTSSGSKPPLTAAMARHVQLLGTSIAYR